jgi:dihydrofolate reductase
MPQQGRQQVMTDYWKDVDTILMGRKTYAVAGAQNRATAKNTKKAKRRTRSEPGMRTYVFSRTFKVIDEPRVELVAGDAVAFVRDLKRKPGKQMCLMGGGELAQSLLGAGLMDEIRLNIHPILLGSGIPTFRDPGHRVKLMLTECRRIEGDCILASYKVSQTE